MLNRCLLKRRNRLLQKFITKFFKSNFFCSCLFGFFRILLSPFFRIFFSRRLSQFKTLFQQLTWIYNWNPIFFGNFSTQSGLPSEPTSVERNFERHIERNPTIYRYRLIRIGLGNKLWNKICESIVCRLSWHFIHMVIFPRSAAL